MRPNIVYKCPLDESVPVVEVPFGDVMGTKSHAFLVQTDTEAVIVVDANIRDADWFTPHHLTAIFAHELGHLARGTDEELAERWAIDRLAELKERHARDLLIERGIA
jgi:hypothetical protein